MSSPIMPAEGPLAPAGEKDLTPYPASMQGTADSFGSELGACLRALEADARSGPPPEVLDQIEVAGRISRRLDEIGHTVRFSEVSGGRIAVELHDREGHAVRSMSISEALELAGESRPG